jgi:hypothetical protein
MLPTAAVLVAFAVAPPPAVQVAALARQYQAFDLPLPPREAKLMRLTWLRPDNPPGHRSWVEVGFPLATDTKGRPSKVLVGLNEERWYAGEHYLEEELKVTNWNGLTSQTRWNEPILAAQCEAIGQHDLAMVVWEAWMKKGGTLTEANSTVARLGWEWWVRQFQYHDADQAKVARRLQLIAVDHPAADADLLRRLKLSLQPSEAKPGSVEALIDELLDVSVFPVSLFPDDRDPREAAILRLGFEAVPTLIDHLDDERLTRSRTATEAINWDIRISYPYQVRHFARDFLYGYMAHSTAERDRIDGKLLTKKDAEAWWADAKKEGEEAYLMRQVGQYPSNEHLLTVLQEKYPKRLPDVFAALKKEDAYWIDLRPLVTVLVRSALPTPAKKMVLLEVLESRDEDWQANALEGLQRIDLPEFHKQLVTVLGDLPTWKDKVKDEHLLPACHTNIAALAMLTNDDDVWTAMGKYLASATPDVKVEWIDHLTMIEPTDKCYLQAVGCSATLLSDKSVQMKKNGLEVTVVEVRNHAAVQLGELLKLKTEPSAKWTAVEWEKYRTEVAKAAEKVTKKKS